MHILYIISLVILTSLLAMKPAELAKELNGALLLSDEGIQHFEKYVRPLFAQQCQGCHGPQKQKGGLRLDSPEWIKKGGDSGSLVQAHDLSKSLIYKAVSYQDELKMPPRGKLTAQEIDHLKRWIELGAPLPAGTEQSTERKGKDTFDLAQRKKHWCYQPLHSPPVPITSKDQWSFTDVDRFVFSRLNQSGLKPARDIDKSGWLRRVTFDLTGLPPTISEIEAFEKDTSVEAYSRVVDRLLASPSYGVRWARHWLDLMRYADTLGHEFDFDLPNAWRYRNYVIRALNDDINYQQFVMEHLAGDILPSPRMNQVEKWNESIQATAFLWLGEAKQAPVDVRQEQADRIDNQIDVIGKAFLGQTIACARCHDHKFDAIAARDYYALYGVLKSSRYQQACIDDPKSSKELREGLRKSQESLHHQALSTPDVADHWNKMESLYGDLPELNKYNDLPLDRLIANGLAWQLTPAATVARYRHPKSKQTLLRYVPRNTWDSGMLSENLEGALRSPTFPINSRYLHILAAGWGGRIRIVVDGFFVIRDPIYGGLRRLVNDPQPNWQTFDLNMWQGREAFVEFLDGGPADPSLGADSVQGKDAWLQIRKILLSNVKQTPSNEKAAQLELQLLTQLNKEDANWRKTDSVESKLKAPPPRYALATAEGNGGDEHIFIRGNHRIPGEMVPRGLSPLFCGSASLPVGASSGRLQLAESLIDPLNNPLLARVIVNRIWKHHFGQGLVRSVDDFGHMGEAPSHPELLDYLAQWFIKNGWSHKKLHRELVLSRTYRQMSANSDSTAVDPLNRMLSHMPLRRIEAEAIRDAMLAISGELKQDQVGEGVMPYLTNLMQGRGRPSVVGPLDGGGKRSIYLSVRRNFLPPLFVAFDFPTPFTTMGRRSTSNIPAQSLAMMNDPLVNEFAKKWAGLMLKQRTDRQERLNAMALMAFGHLLTPDANSSILEYAMAREKAYGGHELAAWAEIAHALFCSKEFIYIP